MTNPTTREREAAKKIFEIVLAWEYTTEDNELLYDRIAAALVRERREALTEAAEVVNITPVPLCYPIGFSTEIAHNIERETRYSIAAAIERLRDGK